MVLICAMDCNPRVQLIHIRMLMWEWTAILEPKVPTVSCSSSKMNQPQSPKTQKKNFGITPDAKMGSAKKIANKIFLPILDAVAKFLLIINSKHPTQKLG